MHYINVYIVGPIFIFSGSASDVQNYDLHVKLMIVKWGK